MQTKNFLELLGQHAEKELIFEYQNAKFVPASYHITEIKNVHIESVDCGGRPDAWDETVVQLWIGSGAEDKHMLAGKALSIFEKVDGVKPIKRDTEIFMEWGTAELLKSNYSIKAVKEQEDKIVIQLFTTPTACKPKLELSVLGKSTGGCC